MSEPLDHLQHVQAEIERIVSLASRDRALQPRVPACPDWNLGELLTHVGRTHRLAASAIIDQRPLSKNSPDQPGSPEGVVAWLQAGASRVLDALGHDPADSAWSFDPQGCTVGFWRRRQALENLVHRIDGEQALDARTPVDPDLASDGVSEVIDVMMRLRRDEGALHLPAGSVELHATDTGHTWTIGEGEPAAQVNAPAEQLLLVLWKRASGNSISDDPVALGIVGADLTP